MGDSNNGDSIQENREIFPEEPIRRWPVQRGGYDHEAGPSRIEGSCEGLCEVHCPCHPNYQAKVTGKGSASASASASGSASSVLWRRSNLQRAQSYGGVTNDRQENPDPGFWTPPANFLSEREDIYKYWFPSDERPRVCPELSKKRRRIPSSTSSGNPNESPRVGSELSKKRRRIPSSTSSRDPNGSPSSSCFDLDFHNFPKDPQASTSASGSGTHNDPEEPIQRLPIQRGGSEAGQSRPPDELTTASNPSEPNENPPSSAVNNPEITVREEHATGSQTASGLESTIRRGGSEAGLSRPPDEITTASNPSEPNENPPSLAVNNPVREEHATGSQTASGPESTIQRGGSEADPSQPFQPDEITTASNPSEPNENPSSSAVNNPEITVREEHTTGSNHKKGLCFQKSWFKKAWFKKPWFKKPLFKKPSWFKK